MSTSSAAMTAAGEWVRAHPGFVLAGAAGAFAAWWAVRPIYRWRFRRVPGPQVLPLLGNLAALAQKGDIYDFLVATCREYTSVWQMWLGVKPHVVISDADLARRVLTRYTSRPDLDDMMIRHGEDRVIWNSSLLFARGAKWRSWRKAFEAAVMHPKNLMAQAPFVAQCADRLCARLQRYADSGEPVDVLPLVYAMTMDAVGMAAFGLDLQATGALGGGNGGEPANVDGVARLQLSGAEAAGGSGKAGTAADAAPVVSGAPPDNWWITYPLGSREFGQHLVHCAVVVMKSMNLETSSVYAILPMFFPYLDPVLRFVSYYLPDPPMREEKRCFKGLREACKVILRAWRQQKASDDAKVASVISEQGFVARLLTDMDSKTPEALDEHMTDIEVVGNAIGVVVTGYETTGSSIASSLYYLSHNMEAQRRLQKEVDEVVGGKEVTPEDLERLPYLNAVFQETLRLRPPGNAAVREVTDAGCDLGNGIIVPKGTHLFIPTCAYMVDPKVWGPTASEFRPERHLPGHEELAPSNATAFMPFGGGARMCVGYKFAQLEAKMGLARLMQRFTFEPAPGAPQPKWVTSLAYSPDRMVLHVARRGGKAASA